MKFKEIGPHWIKNAAQAALDNFDNFYNERMDRFFREKGRVYQKTHWFTKEVTTHFRTDEEIAQKYPDEYSWQKYSIKDDEDKLKQLLHAAEIAIKINCTMELDPYEVALIKKYID